MMKKLFSIILAFATCANAFSHKAIQESAPEWYKRFMTPAPETYPWTFWYWMYGCVTDEGIKLDLEAMHDAGIAGFYLMPIKDTTDGKGYNGTARQLSPEWWKRMDTVFLSLIHI